MSGRPAGTKVQVLTALRPRRNHPLREAVERLARSRDVFGQLLYTHRLQRMGTELPKHVYLFGE